MDNNTLTMKELPESERPYEKCQAHGAAALSDGELLAVLLKAGYQGQRVTELAGKLLSRTPGGGLAGICQMAYEELIEIKGIGPVKAVQILCLSELVNRILRSRISLNSLTFHEPGKIAAYFMPSMRHLETEQVRLLVLDGKNAVAKELVISNGSFNAAMAAPREVFYYALKYKAISIVLLHNHPSGDPTPSKADLKLTRKLADTGKMVGIPLLDHIIIGDNRFISFMLEGYLSS
jgi:DNA repair protein radc